MVRVRPDVWIEHDGFAGKLLNYPLQRGVCRILRNVRYRKHRPVIHHVVVRWKAGLPQGRDEPWFLMTDLDRPAWRISALYARRMSIEELFRDAKSRRNGFALRAVRLKKADRIDRLLLIVTLAYILLVGLGRLALDAPLTRATSRFAKRIMAFGRRGESRAGPPQVAPGSLVQQQPPRRVQRLRDRPGPARSGPLETRRRPCRHPKSNRRGRRKVGMSQGVPLDGSFHRWGSRRELGRPIWAGPAGPGSDRRMGASRPLTPKELS